MEIDNEIISTAILLPSTDSRRVVVSYKRKHVHEVLVKCLDKLAQKKSVVRWTVCPDMTIDVDWDVKNQTKQTIREQVWIQILSVLDPNCLQRSSADDKSSN